MKACLFPGKSCDTTNEWRGRGMSISQYIQYHILPLKNKKQIFKREHCLFENFLPSTLTQETSEISFNLAIS